MSFIYGDDKQRNYIRGSLNPSQFFVIIGKSSAGHLYFLTKNINRYESSHPDYHWVSKDPEDFHDFVVCYRDTHNGKLPYTYNIKHSATSSPFEGNLVKNLNPFTGETIDDDDVKTTLENDLNIVSDNLYHGVWYNITPKFSKYQCVKLEDYSKKPFGGESGREYDLINLELSFVQFGGLTMFHDGKCSETTHNFGLKVMISWASEQMYYKQRDCDDLTTTSKHCIFATSLIPGKKNCNGNKGYKYGYGDDGLLDCGENVLGKCKKNNQVCIFSKSDNKFSCRDAQNTDNTENKVSSKSSSNTVLYVIIGTVAVLLLIGIMYYFFRKSGNSQSVDEGIGEGQEMRNITGKGETGPYIVEDGKLSRVSKEQTKRFKESNSGDLFEDLEVQESKDANLGVGYQ